MISKPKDETGIVLLLLAIITPAEMKVFKSQGMF
jgi:hypothetical protein